MKKINYLDSIKSPVITEKIQDYLNKIKLFSKCMKMLLKLQLKILKKYLKKVIKINTINKKPKKKMVRGRLELKKDLKKAVITLKKAKYRPCDMSLKNEFKKL